MCIAAGLQQYYWTQAPWNYYPKVDYCPLTAWEKKMDHTLDGYVKCLCDLPTTTTTTTTKTNNVLTNNNI